MPLDQRKNIAFDHFQLQQYNVLYTLDRVDQEYKQFRFLYIELSSGLYNPSQSCNSYHPGEFLCDLLEFKLTNLLLLVVSVNI